MFSPEVLYLIDHFADMDTKIKLRRAYDLKSAKIDANALATQRWAVKTHNVRQSDSLEALEEVHRVHLKYDKCSYQCRIHILRNKLPGHTDFMVESVSFIHPDFLNHVYSSIAKLTDIVNFTLLGTMRFDDD